MVKNKQILEIKINNLKVKMYKSAREKGFCHKDTVRISEELDQLILLTI